MTLVITSSGLTVRGEAPEPDDPSVPDDNGTEDSGDDNGEEE